MAADGSFGTLPVVDVSPLVSPVPAGREGVARQIEAACREHGFFYVTGHGVPPELLSRLAKACIAFFALPPAEKMEIAMARGGPAWRGYFPVGAELTSGKPDLKEGLYFGADIGDMLDRLTGGWYRSTPHRVRNASGRDRLSFPFFFDPDFSAAIPPLPGRAAVTDGGRPRWDGQNLHAFTGTYGDYLLGKVSKVFPQLRRDVLTDLRPAARPASRCSPWDHELAARV